MKTQLVIFDFDGTLGDTRRTIVATVQQTLQEMGLPVTDEAAIVATIGLPLKACYQSYAPQLSDAALQQCMDIHHRRFDQNRRVLGPVLFPHVKETLEALHARGLQLTVASSRTTVSLRELLFDLGVAPLFSYVLGSEDVQNAKPHPEPVLKTLAALGVEADAALVVGDMAVDILMGARAGARTCGVTYGNGTREQLSQAGAHHIIDDFAQLTEALL